MLQAYVDNEVGSSARVILEQHVGECEDCRLELRGVQGGSAFLFETFSQVRLERDLVDHTLGHLPDMDHPIVDVVGVNFRAKNPTRWRERMVRLVPVAAAVLLVVLAAIINENWPAASLTPGTIGIVSQDSGEVYRIAKNSTERVAAPATTLTLSGDRFETGPNATMMLTLLGPTEVRVAENTRIRIHDERKLSVEKGHVFLDVAHGERLFKVTTPTGDITVFGTSFDVWVEADETTVVVEEGEVQLGHTEDESVFSIVKPGNGATVISDQGWIRPRPVNVTEVTAWAKEIVADEEAQTIFAKQIAPLADPVQVLGRNGYFVRMNDKSLSAVLIEWAPTSAFASYCDYELRVFDDQNEALFGTIVKGSTFANPHVTSMEIENVGDRRQKLGYIFVTLVPIREEAKREVSINGVNGVLGSRKETQ